jgi:hypothetical protein
MITSPNALAATSVRQHRIHSLRLPSHQPNRQYGSWQIQQNMAGERQKRTQMTPSQLCAHTLQMVREMRETESIPMERQHPLKRHK